MSTGPRYARRTDSNHTELRNVIKECQQAFPQMKIKWMDTSNLGGKMGDGVIQFWNVVDFGRIKAIGTMGSRFNTHLLEFKSSKKANLTKSQKENPLTLVRIDDRADIFELLGQNDWELADG